jgi:serine/threonine-protein kinase RsbW/stage II sporulation protein AB (anti-sigma F factor)
MDPPALIRRFPAHPDQIAVARHAAITYAAEHGDMDLHAIALAVSEAVSNAVIHAYRHANGQPGEVELILEGVLDDGLRIVVSDNGLGMAPRPDSPGLGLGLPLIRRLADRVEVQALPAGGTQLCMHFDVIDRAP